MDQAPRVGYLVFGRKAYAEPLRYQGPWSGPPERAALEAAYGGDWLELVLIPEGSIRWVLREREEAHA